MVFERGVNILVGRPNTGKTKWLQTLDYILGDAGENPFDVSGEVGLAEKYDAAAVELFIGEECFWVRRLWREPGAKTKVFVGDKSLSTSEFQHFLMEKLGIPLLHFPKGNPMSGQTWPGLSFRMLLRHIYRQQRFWGGIADQQPDGEQHACLLQFLGVAERLFTPEYGQLVQLKADAERLKARREQYAQTLDELARDVLSEPGLTIGANPTTVRQAEQRLAEETTSLRERRTAVIAGARDQVIAPNHLARADQLGQQRAELLVSLEELQRRSKATAERLQDVNRYCRELGEELDRLARAEDAGEILADLKITHCPACDQPVEAFGTDARRCFLCHQDTDDETSIEELGAARLRFERDRLTGELKEGKELLDVLRRDSKRLTHELKRAEEKLRMLENQLAPARQAVSAFIQDEVSAIDMALGELNERQRQLGRVSAALETGQRITDLIASLEKQIEPLQVLVNEAVRATDFLIIRDLHPSPG